MALTTLSTGISAPLNGTITIPASVMDPTANTITLQFDITQHLSGNPAAVTISTDVSLDGGATWQLLCSAARDKGYDASGGANPGIASIIHPLPGVGNPQRMVRVSLSTTATVTTSGQLIPAVVA